MGNADGGVACELGLGGWMRPGHVGDEGVRILDGGNCRPNCLEVIKMLGSDHGEGRGW